MTIQELVPLVLTLSLAGLVAAGGFDAERRAPAPAPVHT
jgi:hypothetical protein